MAFQPFDDNLFINNPANSPGILNGNRSSNNSVFGNIGKDNPLIPGLDVFSNLVGAFTGLGQLGLSKDAFKFNKNLTRTNLKNQATITNQAIADKLRAASVQSGGSGRTATGVAANQLTDRRIQGTL